MLGMFSCLFGCSTSPAKVAPAPIFARDSNPKSLGVSPAPSTALDGLNRASSPSRSVPYNADIRFESGSNSPTILGRTLLDHNQLDVADLAKVAAEEEKRREIHLLIVSAKDYINHRSTQSVANLIAYREKRCFAVNLLLEAVQLGSSEADALQIQLHLQKAAGKSATAQQRWDRRGSKKFLERAQGGHTLSKVWISRLISERRDSIDLPFEEKCRIAQAFCAEVIAEGKEGVAAAYNVLGVLSVLDPSTDKLSWIARCCKAGLQLQKAADLGDEDACVNLSRLLYEGTYNVRRGLNARLGLAEKYLQVPASAGNIQGHYWLGVVRTKRYLASIPSKECVSVRAEAIRFTKGLKNLEVAAKAGVRLACHRLASLINRNDLWFWNPREEQLRLKKHYEALASEMTQDGDSSLKSVTLTTDDLGIRYRS